MLVALTTPVRDGVPTGNRMTATRLAEILRDRGHDLVAADAEADLLVALHAAKSHREVAAFRRRRPRGRIVVVVTGTDLYPAPGEEALSSFDLADRIVVLQALARERIPAEVRDRAVVIVQGAAPPPPPGPWRDGDFFDVAVVGHLRAVKDPLRAAAAARLLPPESRVRVRHAGAVLDPDYEAAVERERAENPRYDRLGEIAPDDARRLLAGADVAVVSSRDEGGGRVIGEAVVSGTPVLAARNDASRSLLGEDWPGLFAVGDTAALAALLRRAEVDDGFYAELRGRTARRAPLFDPERELREWGHLLDELAGEERR